MNDERDDGGAVMIDGLFEWSPRISAIGANWIVEGLNQDGVRRRRAFLIHESVVPRWIYRL